MLEELKMALNAHDWYFEMSDDPGAFIAGRRNLHRILDLANRAIDAHGAAARKVIKDFYIGKSAYASSQINPYKVLKHYM